jgi:hypothetical protein
VPQEPPQEQNNEGMTQNGEPPNNNVPMENEQDANDQTPVGQDDESKPLFPIQNLQAEGLVMTLTNVDPLDYNAGTKWVEITAEQLANEIQTSLNVLSVQVDVTLVSQDPPFQDSQRSLIRRHLQDEPEQVLEFSANYAIESESQVDDINSFVTGAFVSNFKRTLYLTRLRTLGGSSFQDVSDVSVASNMPSEGEEEDGDEPNYASESDMNSDGTSSPEKDGNTGAIVGVMIMVIIVSTLGIFLYRRRRQKQTMEMSAEQEVEKAIPIGLVDPNKVVDSKSDHSGTVSVGHSDTTSDSKPKDLYITSEDGSIFTNDTPKKNEDGNPPWFNSEALSSGDDESIYEEIEHQSKMWFRFSRGSNTDKAKEQVQDENKAEAETADVTKTKNEDNELDLLVIDDDDDQEEQNVNEQEAKLSQGPEPPTRTAWLFSLTSKSQDSNENVHEKDAAPSNEVVDSTIDSTNLFTIDDESDEDKKDNQKDEPEGTEDEQNDDTNDKEPESSAGPVKWLPRFVTRSSNQTDEEEEEDEDTLDKSLHPTKTTPMTPRSLRPNKNSSFKKTSDDTASSTIGEFTVTIPPGKLGILLQSSLDGYPKVEDIKLDSPFEKKVQAGDSLISIDGQDLHGYKVEVVSHILDYKKDNATRTFVFSRGN